MLEKLLISGAGGDIAIAIARVVRENALATSLVGAEVRDHHPAASFFDDVHRLPVASDPTYPDALRSLLEMTSPQVFVPMSEAELKRLNDDDFRGFRTTDFLMPAQHVLTIGLDKWNTYRFLIDHGFPAPVSGLVGRDPFPVGKAIVKPRQGQGSKNMLLVGDDASRARAHESHDGALWQEYLADDDAEFTCGVVRFPGIGIRTIQMRRKLAGGLTSTAIIEDDPTVRALLEKLADAIDLRGSINVQLRMDHGLPKIFEINPRFSSTVGFRHRLGFRDFLWALEDLRGLPVGDYVPPPIGTRLYRVGQEVIEPADLPLRG